jgi:hypothetical protein
MLSPLAAWETYYVIVGAAAGALTGLQFVVITLVAQMRRGSAETNRAFGTPTIVHFCAVLFISAIASAPWPSLVDVAIALVISGLAGLLYSAVILRTVRRQTDYQPVLEDWVWHFTLPPVGYATLLIAGLTLQRNTTLALFLVGAVALLFLFIGIHNAWDSVTFIALQQHQE